MLASVAAGLMALTAHSAPEPPRFEAGQPAPLEAPFLHLEGMRAELTTDADLHTIWMPASSTRGWDVQLLSRLPIEEFSALSQTVRVEFEIRASRNHTARVKLLEAQDPWPALGLDEAFEIGTEWARQSFDFARDPEGRLMMVELPHQGAFVDIQFSALAGTVEVRNLRLSSLVPALPEVTLAPPQTEAEVFAWADELVANFEAKDYASIRRAWAEDYVEVSFWDDGTVEEVGLEDAERMWYAQIVQTFPVNGPWEMFLDSLEVDGDTLVATGYWSGSWRLGTWDALSEGGMSFAATLNLVWEKAPDGWRLARLEMTPAEPFEDSSPWEAKHEALRKRLGLGG